MGVHRSVLDVDGALMRRSKGTAVVLVVALATAAAALAGSTGASFSSSAVNPGNSFSAAATFATSQAIDSVVTKSSAGATAYNTTVLADSPVAYWRLGESGSTSTATDASGNGRDGNYAATTIERGRPGAVGDGNGAARWDSIAPEVSVAHAAPLNLNGSFSIELWARIENLQTGSSGARALARKGATADANGWRIDYFNTGVLRLTRNSAAFDSAPVLHSPGFHHLVVTYDGATVSWYVDGRLSTTASATFPASAGTSALEVGPVGARPAGELFVLDEPALYASALSPTRVNAHYATGQMLRADPCAPYRVYANLSGAGITSATADLSAVTAGATAVPLAAGSYSIGGAAYSFRSGALTAGVQPGTYPYTITWVDGAGSHTEQLTAVVENPARFDPHWLTGFEHGVSELGVPDLMSQWSGTQPATSQALRNGARGLQLTKTGTTAATATKDGFTATTALSFAFRFKTSLPTNDVQGFASLAASTTPLYLGYQASTQRLTLRWGSTVAAVSTSSVAAATWYVIDLGIDVGTNPNTATWRVDGVDQPAAGLAGAPQTASSFVFGSTVATDLFTVNFDDVVHSRSLFDYPIGATRVLPLRPSGVGTHSNPQNFQHEDGTAVTSTVATRLDDLPMSTMTDGVRQVVASATSYLELAMEDTAEPCVRGVQAIGNMHKTASQANHMKTSVFSGSTETPVWNGDSMSTNSVVFKTARVPAATAPWGASELNALVFRIGYSTDVAPNPYWDALLLEYVTAG